MQRLRNIRISIQGQPYNKQVAWALKHDRTWAHYVISLASALQSQSEGISDLIGLV